jgi:ligand-binding sensor domain-containing protein
MYHGSLIALLLFLLIFSNSQAQNETNAQPLPGYIFRTIDNTNGLLNNHVMSLAQDHRLFMWISTMKGLQRYDGLRFVNYLDSSDNPGEVNWATSLFPHAWNNSIEIIKGGWQPKQLHLFRNEFVTPDPEHIIKSNGDKYTDWNGDTWAVHKNYPLHPGNTAQENTGYSLLVPPNKHYYFSNFTSDTIRHETWMIDIYSDLLLFDDIGRKIYSPQYNSIAHPLLKHIKSNSLVLRNKTMDSHGNIWLITWSHSFFRFNINTQQLSTYSVTDIIKDEGGKKTLTGSANVVMEDNHGAVWIGTSNAGLLKYNPEKNNFSYAVNREENNTGIQYNYEIHSLFQDKEENIWVGTDKGVSIFNPYRQHFNIIQHEPYNTQSLPKSEINAIIETAAGDLMIGTWGGGISIYDSALRFKKTINFDHIRKNEVWCFAQNDDGTIWAGAQHGWLHVIDANRLSVRTIRPPELDKSTIRSMVKDTHGNLWLGLHNGKVIQWNKEKKKFLPSGYSSQPDSLAASVTNMFIDRSQNLWVSTLNGFRQFDMSKQMFIATYKSNRKNATAISSPHSYGVEEYNDSILLVGTEDGGMNFFDTKTKSFTKQVINNDNSPYSVYAIKKDKTGNIWFTANYTIYKFIPHTGKFVAYTPGKGVISSFFTGSSFLVTRNGQWFAWTSSKIVGFFPDSFNQQKSNAIPATVTGFKVFDKPFLIDSLLHAGKPVKLSYKQNFLSIEFAAIQFSGIQQTEYFYQLSDIDKDWVHAGTKQFADYTDLKPGEYIFSVKAENGIGISQPTSFTIVISPPFWQTWWFRLIIIFCVLSLIYLFIKWRERNIKIIEIEKLKVQHLNSEQYKNKLEMELIINYFSSSLLGKNTEDDVLWDVANNLVGRLGFVDCMIYLWNTDKTKMIQRAGFGPKGSIDEINRQPFDVAPGQGVVGHVMQTKEAVLIPDTSKDSRYREDEMTRLSEITVPVIYNDELIGVIDSEHHEKNFFTPKHLHIMSTIATLMANKIESINAEQSLRQSNIEMYSINEQLSKAKLEALRAQMNPHFIFNCLNSIDNLIQMDEKERATLYLSKFAKLIRSILENSTNNVVSCWKDMETLQLYLELEALRFDNKFSYQVSIAGEIMNGDYEVPPLVIQPFVENAIHHGLLNKIENDKKLLVDVSIIKDHIHYRIEDNGVGRAKAESYKQLNKPAYESMGMQITADRINLFNNNTNSSVKITDLYDEYGNAAGTKVEVALIIHP